MLLRKFGPNGTRDDIKKRLYCMVCRKANRNDKNCVVQALVGYTTAQPQPNTR
jgi:hypothetical protein